MSTFSQVVLNYISLINKYQTYIVYKTQAYCRNKPKFKFLYVKKKTTSELGTKIHQLNLYKKKARLEKIVPLEVKN